MPSFQLIPAGLPCPSKTETRNFTISQILPPCRPRPARAAEVQTDATRIRQRSALRRTMLQV